MCSHWPTVPDSSGSTTRFVGRAWRSPAATTDCAPSFSSWKRPTKKRNRPSFNLPIPRNDENRHDRSPSAHRHDRRSAMTEPESRVADSRRHGPCGRPDRRTDKAKPNACSVPVSTKSRRKRQATEAAARTNGRDFIVMPSGSALSAAAGAAHAPSGRSEVPHTQRNG